MKLDKDLKTKEDAYKRGDEVLKFYEKQQLSKLWVIGKDFFRICKECERVYSSHETADNHFCNTGHSVNAYPTHEYMEEYNKK